MAGRYVRSSSYSKGTSKDFKRQFKEIPPNDTVRGRPSESLNLDTDDLFLTAFNIKTCTKRLRTLGKDISRKKKKEKSKRLARCEEDYNESYNDLVKSATKLKEILQLKDSDTRDSGYDSCKECDRKQHRIWKLEQQNKRSSGIDLEKYALDLSRAENKVYELQKEVDSLKKKLNKESTEKEEAIRRLSEIASSKLRDNNPNIADLSDKNRPTKLAEQVSEIYDNEWTEAFDELSENNYNDRDIIDMLLKVFMDIFEECKRVTTDGYIERVRSCMEQTDMLPNSLDDVLVELPQQLSQQIKEFRKHRAGKIIDRITEGILRQQRLVYLQRSPYTNECMKPYVTKCIQVSWLMCVQDPPMLLSIKTEPKFNLGLFREYTKRGPYVEYVVWPAMYLHEDGHILSKGVAQGTKEQKSIPDLSSNYQRLGSTSWDGIDPLQMHSGHNAQSQDDYSNTQKRHRNMNQSVSINVYNQDYRFKNRERQVQGQNYGQSKYDHGPSYQSKVVQQSRRRYEVGRSSPSHAQFRDTGYRNQYTSSQHELIGQQSQRSYSDYRSLSPTYHSIQARFHTGQPSSSMQTDF